MRACRGSLSRLAAEKARSVLLSRAVTQTYLPAPVVRTRIGTQPADAVALSAEAGFVSARLTSMTLRPPCSEFLLRFEGVAESQRPSGDTDMPTGPSPRGTVPT